MRACRHCRAKHLKCDQKLPACSKCEHARIECVRDVESSSPKQTSGTFAKGQVWLPCAPRVDFVLENRMKEPFSSESADTRRDMDRPSQSNPVLDQTTVSSASPKLTAPSRTTRSALPVIGTRLVTTEREALLVRHFIDNVSLFFDVGDAYRHFAFEVPRQAQRNKILLNAMLALSAKHLDRTTIFDAHASEAYLEACLQSLIPTLNDRDAVGDDAVFAAVILLRFLEEMNVPLLGYDPQDHRLGTQAIIAASHTTSPISINGLRRACYWAAFRQEFSGSMLTQKPIRWKVPENLGTLEPTDDFTWALRAVEQCGKVLELIFGEQSPLDLSAYVQLMLEIEAWQYHRPNSFDPVFVANSDTGNDDMARIYLQSECHVNAHQYSVLAHCLLTAHIPATGLGPERRKQRERTDVAVRDDLRKLCGVAVGQPHAPCAALMACYGIELFGDRFDDLGERQELLELLAATEKRHGWPTERIKAQLEESWMTIF